MHLGTAIHCLCSGASLSSSGQSTRLALSDSIWPEETKNLTRSEVMNPVPWWWGWGRQAVLWLFLFKLRGKHLYHLLQKQHRAGGLVQIAPQQGRLVLSSKAWEWENALLSFHVGTSPNPQGDANNGSRVGGLATVSHCHPPSELIGKP